MKVLNTPQQCMGNSVDPVYINRAIYVKFGCFPHLHLFVNLVSLLRRKTNAVLPFYRTGDQLQQQGDGRNASCVKSYQNKKQTGIHW